MRTEKWKSFRVRAIPRAASLLALTFGGSLLANAADLPEGPGRVETTRVCGKCHSLDQAISLRQGKPAWQETISKMVNLGAEGTDTEMTAILNYLTKNYGSGNASPASGGATAATAPPARVEGGATPDGAAPAR